MGIKEMPRLARFIPKIMLAITVTACDEVYRKIACWLNDMGESQTSSFLYSRHTSRAERLLLEDNCSKVAPCGSFSVSCKLQLIKILQYIKVFMSDSARMITDDSCCFSAENYRLQSAYEKNLIIKMVLVSGFSLHHIQATHVMRGVIFKSAPFFLMTPGMFFVLQFQFVNSYLSLFYIGFYLKDMERLKEVRGVSVAALMFLCLTSASVVHLAPCSPSAYMN